MMNRKGTTPYAVATARLLLASFCSALTGNNETYAKHFTLPDPNLLATKGTVRVNSVHRRSDGHFEAVEWEVTLQVKEIRRQRVTQAVEDAADAMVAQQQPQTASTDATVTEEQAINANGYD